MQGREPHQLEQTKDYVATLAEPVSWLQRKFAGVTAAVGQVLSVLCGSSVSFAAC